MNKVLKSELIALAKEDRSLLQSLKDSGDLPDDHYHPKLKQLHEKNTSIAKKIIAENGWPTISQVGEEGSDAIWLVVQHSVLDPEFMISCVSKIEELVMSGEAKGWQLAFLQDRALMLQGKPQIYGTQHILDTEGELIPYEISDSSSVDERRQAVGLEPLKERTRILQADREKFLRLEPKGIKTGNLTV